VVRSDSWTFDVIACWPIRSGSWCTECHDARRGHISPVGEQLVAAVLPAVVTPRPAPAPVAALPVPASRTRHVLGSVAIDVARMARSGKVRAAPLLRALGWLPGSGIDLDSAGGDVAGPRGMWRIVSPDPAGDQAGPACGESDTGCLAGSLSVLPPLASGSLVAK